MGENPAALAEDADFSRAELGQLTRNAFDISWADPASKARLCARREEYLSAAI